MAEILRRYVLLNFLCNLFFFIFYINIDKINIRWYWVEGLTCAKDHLLVPKVVCPMATAYPYASI